MLLSSEQDRAVSPWQRVFVNQLRRHSLQMLSISDTIGFRDTSIVRLWFRRKEERSMKRETTRRSPPTDARRAKVLKQFKAQYWFLTHSQILGWQDGKLYSAHLRSSTYAVLCFFILIHRTAMA